MKPTVLLININDKTRRDNIIKTLLPLGLHIKTIKKEDYLQPLGYLSGMKTINPVEDIYEGNELEAEMLFMANMGSRDVDNLIMAFRKSKLPSVPYKAVLTETNQYWNVPQLFGELKKEHEQFHKTSN